MQKQHLVKLTDEKQLSYTECGDPNGIPIFYFHGFPGSRLEVVRFHQAAFSNGYRLIGIDRPGMGLSPIDRNRSILSWATTIENFADSLGIEKFSIVGHSGGGPFVAVCAYAIPHRLNGAAIVSGMAPFEYSDAQKDMARAQRIANKLIIAAPWLATILMKITLLMLQNPKKMMQQMIKQLPEVDQAIFRSQEISNAIIKSTLEAFRNGVAGAAYEMKLLVNPWGFDLKDVKYPVTLWQGTLDKQVPISHAKIYATLMPDARQHIIENEGHHSLLQNHIDEILKNVCQ